MFFQKFFVRNSSIFFPLIFSPLSQSLSLSHSIFLSPSFSLYLSFILLYSLYYNIFIYPSRLVLLSLYFIFSIYLSCSFSSLYLSLSFDLPLSSTLPLLSLCICINLSLETVTMTQYWFIQLVCVRQFTNQQPFFSLTEDVLKAFDCRVNWFHRFFQKCFLLIRWEAILQKKIRYLQFKMFL